MQDNGDKITLGTKPPQPDLLDGTLACTLSGEDIAKQALEWSDLGALALTSDRVEDGVASTYPIAIADAVEDLARREADCCGSWLSAATERQGEVIRLQITTRNPDGLAIILRMAGHQS